MADVPVARCKPCDTTRRFSSLANRNAWAARHTADTGHTVLTWEEPWSDESEDD